MQTKAEYILWLFHQNYGVIYFAAIVIWARCRLVTMLSDKICQNSDFLVLSDLSVDPKYWTFGKCLKNMLRREPGLLIEIP